MIYEITKCNDQWNHGPHLEVFTKTHEIDRIRAVAAAASAFSLRATSTDHFRMTMPPLPRESPG